MGNGRAAGVGTPSFLTKKPIGKNGRLFISLSI